MFALDGIFLVCLCVPRLQFCHPVRHKMSRLHPFNDVIITSRNGHEITAPRKLGSRVSWYGEGQITRKKIFVALFKDILKI